MARIFAIICLHLLILVAIQAEVKDRFYPRYHLAPPQAWMNDPNGFSLFKNEYHLFYQYNPETSLEPGIAHWGHAKSKDLFHWEHLPIAIYPNSSYDRTGAFSGSAFIEDDTMYLFYTGNVEDPTKTVDQVQLQALAVSTDGIHVTKYDRNPIIYAPNRQPNIRDPKVWQHDSKYYMVIGNSYKNDSMGQILLFESDDKIKWKEVSILGQSNGTLGYMWECPDFFELNGKYVLLFSPQGVEPQGDKYQNLYQTGYVVGKFSYDTYEFIPETEFVELDNGHDFYATQTIKDDQGRRLVVAWFDMWQRFYPERQDGWTGQMTIIRELILTEDNVLLQIPVDEIDNIRGKKLRSGKADDKVTELDDKTGEITITADPSRNLEVIIEASDGSAKVSIIYDHDTYRLTLDRGGDDGVRRTNWKPSGDKLKWKIFVDASSIELFCGQGEVTFSSRFFPKSDVRVKLGENTEVDSLSVISLKRSVTVPVLEN